MTLTLGSTNLEKYLTHPKPLDEDRKRKLDEYLDELKDSILGMEQRSFSLMKIEREAYPVISPEFLETRLPITHEGQEIFLPKFSVHKRSASGFADFSIEFPRPSFGEYVEARLSSNNDIFRVPLLKTVEYSDYDSPCFRYIVRDDIRVYQFRELPRPIRKKYKRLGNLEFEIRLNGLLSKEDKDKISDLDRIFGENLFMVTETNPEIWNSPKAPTKEFMLLGIFDSKCYFLFKGETRQLP